MVQWRWAGGWLQIMVHRVKLYLQEEDHFKIASILSSFVSKISLIWVHEVSSWIKAQECVPLVLTVAEIKVVRDRLWRHVTHLTTGSVTRWHGDPLRRWEWLPASRIPSTLKLTITSTTTAQNSPLTIFRRKLSSDHAHALAHHHHPLINPITEGGGTLCPPLRNIALNQVIWGPEPPKLIDFS